MFVSRTYLVVAAHLTEINGRMRKVGPNVTASVPFLLGTKVVLPCRCCRPIEVGEMVRYSPRLGVHESVSSALT